MGTDLDPRIDRLYALLPAVYRQRDADHGYVLQALLRVIAEQVNAVEDDIAQLYDNWFIETCQDWVVPYIGDLVGYHPVHEAGEPGDVRTPRARQRNKILIPRRDVADTVRNRRRKGTLALLEELAGDVAGWPARAVEFYRLLAWTQHLNHLRLAPPRGGTVDLRCGEALEQIGGPFDALAHTVDVRRVSSCTSPGRYNIPSVGLFVWRLRAYSVTCTPACCLDNSPHCCTFSIAGNDTPLYRRPEPETDPAHIAEPTNLPIPISRRYLERHRDALYGDGKSLQIWLSPPADSTVPPQRRPIPAVSIVAADLTDWIYQPRRGKVAVDPQLGRIAFPPARAPIDQVVWVSYQYAFSADLGGGEYDRVLRQPAEYVLYRVGEQEELKTINAALSRWKHDLGNDAAAPEERKRLQHAVVEITDSGLYEESIEVHLGEQQSLQLRAASATRPVIGLSNVKRAQVDALTVSGRRGSRFTLDGVMVLGRAVHVLGPRVRRHDPSGDLADDLAAVTIRHSTLVPGWALDCDCEPQQPGRPSLELRGSGARLTVEHSILGPIQVIEDGLAAELAAAVSETRLDRDDGAAEPVAIRLSDTILDATGDDREALGAPGCAVAHAVLTAARCTVLGGVQTHAIELAENCIFAGIVTVARRQTGCMRFCYVPPGSRTPRRYECQPDKAERAAEEALRREPGKERLPTDDPDVVAARGRERARVRPQFNSTRYGTPAYCQLAHSCAEEITRGADDESEMGAFHDLFNPQRAANLRARLDEYTPAGMDAGIIFAS
jgi:hypothetical protein